MKCIDGSINQIDSILIAASPRLTKLKMNPHARNVLCVGSERTRDKIKYWK